MTLATRCPACNTVFRVVQDQLRVSEGWVRCGRCSEVFNAVEHMVNTASAAPVPPVPPASPDFAAPRVQTTSTSTSGSAIPAAAEDDNLSAFKTAAPAPAAPRAHHEVVAEVPLQPFTASAPIDELPSFMRAAQRTERWQQPFVRRSLAAAILLALLGLGAQVFIEYRDLIAARWPALRPTADLLCQGLGCRVGLPRMTDALVVESSGLVRIEGTPTYRLSVVLRNRAALELAMPALDLHLTDSQGRTIARRTVAATELGITQDRLLAGAELAMHGTLAVLDRSVSGYTIDVYYP